MTESELRQRIKEYTHIIPRGPLNIIAKTTEFMDIKAGDILELNGSHYLVRGEEYESRYGMEGEPKFWVKRAIDLATGMPKIIKLVFHESFKMHLGDEEILCYRSPQKEARILQEVKGDPHFMQGATVIDPAGNHIRIIDKIRGVSLYDFIRDLEMDHETYFHQYLPSAFRKIIGCVEAINRLHAIGWLHGDIRNDHIYVDRDNGDYIWIDFDYTYDWVENPFGVDLHGLGNVLTFIVGKGFYTVKDVAEWRHEGERLAACLHPSDMSLFSQHRIINLKKLFPYIPHCVNQVLMFFSYGTDVFYETVEELLSDLKLCEKELPL